MLPAEATNSANHLLFKSVKGADGDPAAMAAYRTGRVIEGIDGRVHNPRRTDVVATGLTLPANAPERWQGEDATQALWMEVAAAELNTNDRVAAGMGGQEPCIFRRNVSIARTAIMALPADETQEVREQIVREFSAHIAAETACAVEWAVHAPPDEGSRNWHAHLMVSPRVVTEDGFGERAKKWSGRKTGPELIRNLREKFELITNTAVTTDANKIDMRSLRERAKEARQNGDEKMAEELLARRQEKIANPRATTPEFVKAARAQNGPQKRPVVEPRHEAPTLVSPRGAEGAPASAQKEKAPEKREVLTPGPLPKVNAGEIRALVSPRGPEPAVVKREVLTPGPLPKVNAGEIRALVSPRGPEPTVVKREVLTPGPLPKVNADEIRALVSPRGPEPAVVKRKVLTPGPLPKVNADEIRALVSPRGPEPAEKVVEVEKPEPPKEAPRPPRPPSPSPSPGM